MTAKNASFEHDKKTGHKPVSIHILLFRSVFLSECVKIKSERYSNLLPLKFRDPELTRIVGSCENSHCYTEPDSFVFEMKSKTQLNEVKK